MRFWRLGRARARVGGVDAPRGHVVDDPRPLRASNARSNASNPRFFSRRAPFWGIAGLSDSDPPRLRAAVPARSTRFVRLPPIPPTPRADVSSDLSPPSRSSRTHRISRPGRLLARFWGRPREPTEDRGGRLSLPLAIIPFVAAALHQFNSPSLLEDDADLFSRRLSRPPRAARVRAPRVLAAPRAPPPPRDRREGVSLPRVARV